MKDFDTELGREYAVRIVGNGRALRYKTKLRYKYGTYTEELLRHGPKNHSSLLGGATSFVTHI